MEDKTSYAEDLGDKLRDVRQQQGLSLHDVEVASEGELKASVVGAYERGERAVSVARLRALADFYRVPVSELLPGPRPDRAAEEPRRGLTIDLTRLRVGQGRDGIDVLQRYVTSIQSQRGDFDGRVMTVRAADVQAIAAVLDVDAMRLREELVGAGIASEGG